MGEFSEMVDVGSAFSILMFSTPVWVGGNSNKDSSEGIPSTKNSLLTFAILSIEDILVFIEIFATDHTDMVERHNK
jgi:hypothetical protein